MILNFAGGCMTDDAPGQGAHFTLYSENIRWKRGRPETIDLSARLIDQAGDPINIDIGSERVVTVWNDRGLVMVGAGQTVWKYDYNLRTITTYQAPDSAVSGRWWFISTDVEIICARSSIVGRVYVLDRTTDQFFVLPNSPEGAICGGIVNGVLTLGGTTSFSGLPSPLTVRWSARRGDPPNPDGDSGFEDWTPLDTNSSGEILLDEGVTIVGGGSSSYGFMVWTDKTFHQLSPTADTLVYSPRQLSNKGLLAPGTWTILETTIWWYDHSRKLNVYDGGKPRPIDSPMDMASLELLGPDVEETTMVSNREYSEVLLHYTDLNGDRRQAVHSPEENAWYPFRLDRLDTADRQGIRPAIGIAENGDLFAQSLTEPLDLDYVYPGGPYPHAAKVTQAQFNFGEPEPFNFLLSSNYQSTDNPLQTGVRSHNVVVAHTYARPPEATPLPQPDQIGVYMEWYDRVSRDGALVSSDGITFDVGQRGGDMRGGGEAVRTSIYGIGITTFIRFGDVTIDELPGARR